jgi:ADP-dependent NAD(P)H-hydrate dehydratase / NAD(P)H-hydrate epimerase
MRLVTASEMQEMDRIAIETFGIPGVVLMENAGRGAVEAFMGHFSPPPGAKVLILCGRGNNGGDGYVMARYFHAEGRHVSVVVLSELSRIAGDARIHLQIIQHMGIRILEVPDQERWDSIRGELEGHAFVVDAILGTGLNAPVSGFYGQVIEDVNRSGRPVAAVDIPSGLNADTGCIMGVAVKAALTVTFGFVKIGHVVFPGAERVGRLVRVDISIPWAVSERVPERVRMTEPDDFSPFLKGEMPDTHKGHRGHLLVLAGSTGKTGAATLTATAALRAGAGLVTLGIPEGLNPIMEVKLTEAMTVPLAQTKEGTLALRAREAIEGLFPGKSALAIGPGLSTHPETVALVRHLVAHCPLPMVIDADGLNGLAGALGVLDGRKAETLLTPHPGEMGRLAGLSSAEVQGDRLGVATRFSRDHVCWLVLKGARSLVSGPDGQVYVNPTGNPALASGGSGDVLTGLIGGFLARGWPMERAGLAGCYLQGLAADRLARRMGSVGVLAGELPDAVPFLMEALSQGRWPLDSPPPHRDLCSGQVLRLSL